MKARHYAWCLLAVGVLGVCFYWQKAQSIFPAASIDLHLTKDQVTELATNWADKLGYKESQPLRSTVFAIDENSKTFLEYELGLDKANELMKAEIPVWYWSSRFCKPLDQEEFSVSLTPDGQLNAFDHTIENDKKMKSVTHVEARKMAEDFILSQAHSTLDGYAVIEQGSVTQAHRTDHYFTWQDKVHSYHGARLRTLIYVSGDQITSFNHYLYVPESWSRKFSKLRSYNDALADAASVFYVALNTGAFFIFLWAFASGRIRWRLSLIVGAVYGIFAGLEALNSFPTSMHDYNTTLPFAGFQFEFSFSALSTAFTNFIQIFILTAAAEAIYRLAFPGNVALEKLFTKDGLRSRRTWIGIIAGFGVCGIHLGWIAAYYLIGQTFPSPYKFWCPMEVSNVEALSSSVPVFSAMHVGWYASLAEEFTYRLIGLAAFRKLAKNFWLANLLQAAAWAFMHSNYPQEPPYARGLELTVVGFFYGTILRYFGILPCVFSHNLLDTFLGVYPLLTSKLHNMQFSAALGLLPFPFLLLISFLAIKKYGWLKDEEPVHNHTVSQLKPPMSETVDAILPHSYSYKPLSKKWRWGLGLAVVVFAYLQFFYFLSGVGHNARATITRQVAVGVAREYLTEAGIRPDGLSISAWMTSDLSDTEMQYVFEKDRKDIEKLAYKPENPLTWYVRFFKPLQPEEYLVAIDSSGKPLSFTINLPEKAAGANLTQEEAQQKVEAFLNKQHPEVKGFHFDDVTQEKREDRTDYTFLFTAPQYKVGEADYRLSVDCIGDVVSTYGHSWLVPDAWKFAHEKQHLQQIICTALISIFYFGCGILGVLWARGVVRTHTINWRRAALLSGTLILLAVIRTLNSNTEFWWGYKTETPLVSFYTGKAVEYMSSWISSFSVTIGIIAFGLGALRLLLPRTSLNAIIKTTMTGLTHKDRVSKYNLWIDAVLVGLAAGLGQHATAILFGILHGFVSPVVWMAPLSPFASLVNMASPTLNTVLDAVNEGFFYVFGASIIVGICARYIRNFKQFFLFVLLASLIVPSTERHYQDYLLNAASSLTTFLLAWLCITKLAKENILAYFIAGAVASLSTSIRLLCQFGSAIYLEDITAMIVVLLMPVFYILLMRANLTRSADIVIEKEEPAGDAGIAASGALEPDENVSFHDIMGYNTSSDGRKSAEKPLEQPSEPSVDGKADDREDKSDISESA